MDETIYQVVGYQYGSFTGDDGKKIAYTTLFVISPISGAENPDFHFQGHKAEKLRCMSSEVIANVQVRDMVRLYFDKRGRVSLIENVNES